MAATKDNPSNKRLVDPRRWPGVYIYESTERTYQGRPDGCLYIAYKVDGRRRLEKVGWRAEGYTPQVAAEIRAQRLKAARHGEEVKTAKEISRDRARTNKTVDELAEAYFAAKGGGLKGIKTDRNRYDLHIKPHVGNITAGKLSPLDIARIRKAMTGKAVATQWNALELLRRVMNYGARAHLCPPLKFVIEMPRKDNEVVEYLEPEHLARLMEVLDEWPSQDVARMLRLAMFTGLRRGEIFKLEDRDVDFRQCLITIRAPKGGKTSSVPMNDVACAILKEQLAWREEHFPESHYIFPGRRGDRRTDSNAVDRIKAASGLPREFRIFHGLRHHFAVMLANSGKVSLDMIGELLTHKSNAMTRRYAQFLPDAKRQAASIAAEVISQSAGHKRAGNVIEMNKKKAADHE